MTEIINLIFYNTPSTASALDIAEKCVNIGVSVFTGVIAIIGLGYIKPLKEKTKAATFTFWSQLSVHLTVIRKWIEQDNGILDNMYSSNAKKGWGVLAPDSDRIKQFKETVQETLEYIKAANDQMPAYKGWSEDYAKLIGYLSDMIVYDIGDNTGYFKYVTEVSEAQRGKNCSDICETIKKLCTGIEQKQKEIEQKIV